MSPFPWITTTAHSTRRQWYISQSPSRFQPTNQTKEDVLAKFASIDHSLEQYSVILQRLASQPEGPLRQKYFPRAVHKAAVEYVLVARKRLERMLQSMEFRGYISEGEWEKLCGFLEELEKVLSTAKWLQRTSKLYPFLYWEQTKRVKIDYLGQNQQWGERVRQFLLIVQQRTPAEPQSFHTHLDTLFRVNLLAEPTVLNFVTSLAAALESYPELLENAQILLPPSTKLRTAVNTFGKVSFVTVVSGLHDGAVIPISAEMISHRREQWLHAPVSSNHLRVLMDSREALENMDDRWAPVATVLLELELDQQINDSYTKACRRLLRKLSSKNCTIPASYLLENIERDGSHAVSGGGFADIWRGRLGAQSVCLKVLRLYTDDDRDELFKHLYREVLVWKKLEHPNILPFLGVSLKSFSPSFCMISPWMNNGHIMSFLKRNSQWDRFIVISEIAEGINYLHSLRPPIIHGDIKGSNILVTDEGVCCLADFGLAGLSESHAFSTTTTSTRTGGTTRWLPPEYFLPSQFPNSPRLARDIYAFACTVLEVITGREPFSEPRIPDGAVMMAVTRGERPMRPLNNLWCTDGLWALIEDCWAQTAASRPSAKRVVLGIQDLVQRRA